MRLQKHNTASKLSILVLAVITFFCFNYFKEWQQDKSTPFRSDAEQYYSYLVASFIHDWDLDFSFPNGYWTHVGPKGKKVQKMTMGVALLEAPFFLIGHVYALNSDKYEANGYTNPYSYAVSIGIILYVFLGLFYLRKSLLHVYSEFTVSIAIVTIFLATNLFYYTVGFGAFSHSFLFAIISGIIYCTIKWNKTRRDKYFFIGMFLFGLAVLIRPTHLLLLLFIVLYGVNNFESFKERIKCVSNLKYKLLIGASIFLLPILPQLFYWKYTTGSFLYFSYGDERFFWDNPKLFDFLFSFRKGWFIYTPVMFVAFLGLFISNNKSLRFASLSYILISIYIVSCWWCWWYGGTYGQRVMIDYYPVLAFPLAFWIQKLEKSKPKKAIAIILMVCFITIEFTNIIKIKERIYHHDSMTKEAFFHSLFKLKFKDENELNDYEKTYLSPPDYEGAFHGKR